MLNIKELTVQMLNGCIHASYDGVKLYTPDGMANYQALWTRDFAYIVKNAGELLTISEIESCIEYILNHVGEDGWIPDRVYANGFVRYTAGGDDFPALPNLDNGCFIIDAVYCYLSVLEKKNNFSKAKELFSKWCEFLTKGIECLPTDNRGFIFNDPQDPHSPYGFTDTVCKTGCLAFETLLLWDAKRKLVSMLEKYGFDSCKYRDEIRLIERYFKEEFSVENGMLKAATVDCNQVDLWASCFVIYLDFPLPNEQKRKIAVWFKENIETITERGQLRHLPIGETWEKTFISVGYGTYQNGAYWATPILWLVKTLNIIDSLFAKKVLGDIMDYFEEYGVYECVNKDYRKVASYVVSAVNTYAAYKFLYENN